MSLYFILPELSLSVFVKFKKFLSGTFSNNNYSMMPFLQTFFKDIQKSDAGHKDQKSFQELAQNLPPELQELHWPQ